MIALIKKDWRMNLPLMAGSAAIVAAPYVIMLMVFLFESPRRPEQLSDTILHASGAALWMVALSAVAFGGAAFAQERRDRSSDFLAMLPVTRRAIVVSKIVASFSWIPSLWLANILLVLAVVYFHQGDASFQIPNLSESIGLSVAVMCMFFSVAWLFSTFLRSPSAASVISLVVTVSSMVAVILVVTHLGLRGRSEDNMIWSATLILTGCVSFASFIGGTLYYVRRIEP